MYGFRGPAPTLEITPSSARQRNAIKIAFRWWIEVGLII